MFNKFKELSTSVSRRLITYRGKHLGKTIANTKKHTVGNIVHIGKESLISSQAIIEQLENIYVGNNVQIKHGFVLRPETGFIFIGNNVIINHYTVIHARGGVEIGNWTRIGPHCGIYAQRRDKQLLSLCLFLQGGTRISSFYRFNEGQML